MLSHSGSVSLSMSLLTFEGKYTLGGYLQHVQCFGMCLAVLCFIWEFFVQRGFWRTWVTMRLSNSRP